MQFRRYQHIERFGTDAVHGIEEGQCFVFPKIDGTNASAWLDSEGNLKCGSRNRELTLDNDNAGFYAYMLTNESVKRYLEKYPHHRLFGEFLVPHSLKTYRDDAWRRFYVFDVCIDINEEEVEYLPYDVYQPLLDECNVDYIPPLAKVINGSYERFIKNLEKTGQFLVKDGAGQGEGIVIKNYGWKNRFGKQVWAKIVANEFKEKNHKVMGCPEIKEKTMIEQSIVDEFCTESFIEKEYHKIVTEKNGWRSEYIPILLGRVYYELIKEEMWQVVKKHKFPTVNFKTLNSVVVMKIKDVKKELF